MKIFPTKDRPNFLVITRKRETFLVIARKRETFEKTRKCARNGKEKPESSLPFGLTLSLRVISTTKVTAEQEVDYFNPETDCGTEVDQLQPRTDCAEQK